MTKIEAEIIPLSDTLKKELELLFEQTLATQTNEKKIIALGNISIEQFVYLCRKYQITKSEAVTAIMALIYNILNTLSEDLKQKSNTEKLRREGIIHLRDYFTNCIDTLFEEFLNDKL